MLHNLSGFFAKPLKANIFGFSVVYFPGKTIQFFIFKENGWVDFNDLGIIFQDSEWAFR